MTPIPSEARFSATAYERNNAAGEKSAVLPVASSMSVECVEFEGRRD